MQSDIAAGHAPPSALPDARAPPIFPIAPCPGYAQNPPITIKAGRGGFRANATGGLRSPPGGRPRKAVFRSPPLDVPCWYVVRANHAETALADREIRLAGFEVFSPTIFKPATPPRRDSTGVMRPGKVDRVEFLFVRYVITRLNLSEPDWRDILDLPGVERIISSGHVENGGVGIPIAVPDAAIDWVRALLGPTGCIDPRVHREAKIAAGTSLRFLDGALADHAGICEASDGRRVGLVTSMFNRDNVRVTVSQASVEVA